MLKSKEECFERFKEFKALVETQLEHKIKAFRLDNDGNFTSKVFKRFLKDHDIEKQTSTPYRPEQDGLVERVNRTIVEMTRNMLLYSKPSQMFLRGNGGLCGLHTKPMSNKGVGLHYIRGSLEWKEALYCIHMCARICCLCNGAR